MYRVYLSERDPLKAKETYLKAKETYLETCVKSKQVFVVRGGGYMHITDIAKETYLETCG